MLLRIKRERNGGGRRNVPVAMWSWVRLQASWAKLVAKDPDRMEAVGDRSWQLKILDCCSRKMTSLGPRRAGVSLEAKKEMAEEHKKRSDISKKSRYVLLSMGTRPGAAVLTELRPASSGPVGNFEVEARGRVSCKRALRSRSSCRSMLQRPEKSRESTAEAGIVRVLVIVAILVERLVMIEPFEVVVGLLRGNACRSGCKCRR